MKNFFIKHLVLPQEMNFPKNLRGVLIIEDGFI